MAKRVVPKDLREPDTFQTYTGKVIEYLIKYRKIFAIVLVIICAGALASGGFYYYSLRCEKVAHSMYSAALGSYKVLMYGAEKDQYTKAIELYTEVTKKHPTTKAAHLAFYDLGNIHFILNDVDKSIEAYKEFLKYPSRDNVLTALAYNGVGYCYESIKDYPNALDSFKKSIDHGTGTAYLDLNYGNVARIYEQMNNYKQAKEYYKKALDHATDPVTERLIKRKISLIAYKSDEESDKK